MNKLIVYFSLEGNTDYAANVIAENTGADLLRLVPKKAYHDKGFLKFFWGGKSAVMGEKPELETYETDLSDYDMIIFGFPVWASNFTPPIRTFVEENRDALKDKELLAFTCESGSGGDKALAKLAEFIGIKSFEAETILIDPKAKKSEKSEHALMDFCDMINEIDKQDETVH